MFISGIPYMEKEDDAEDYREERRIRLSRVEELPFIVVFTMRGDTVWIISARLATRAEEELLIAQTDNEPIETGKWHEKRLIGQSKKERKTRIEKRRERDEK